MRVASLAAEAICSRARSFIVHQTAMTPIAIVIPATTAGQIGPVVRTFGNVGVGRISTNKVPCNEGQAQGAWHPRTSSFLWISGTTQFPYSNPACLPSVTFIAEAVKEIVFCMYVMCST